MKLKLFVLAAALITLQACGATSHHYAVVADYAFAQSVNRFDDALFEACTKHMIPADKCNGPIKDAAINLQTGIKAASGALRDAPPNAPLPRSLPDLMSYLNSAHTLLDSLGTATLSPEVQRVFQLLNTAISEVNQLFYIFTPVPKGGK